MKIGIDLMGGDNPQELIKAINKYSKNFEDKLLVYTKRGNDNIDKLKNNDKITLIYCESEVEKDDDPAFVVRSKKDSTLAMGVQDATLGKIDAFISAGNTGALVSCGIFISKRIKGISKPALPGFLPRAGLKTPVMLLDLGANVAATKENMLEYAMIAKTYMKNFYHIENPSIKLLNNGVEENKGTEMYKEVHTELQNNDDYNFLGNIEPRDVLDADCDIILMDGWTGNILLKSIEGAIDFLGKNMKEVFLKNIINKFSVLILKKDLKQMYDKLDYRELGATPILGINTLILKAHGSSNERAFYNAIVQAKNLKHSKFLNTIKDNAK